MFLFQKKKDRPAAIEEMKKKIREEMPELTVAEKGYIKPLFEQMQLYYQIKAIQSQDSHNWIISICTIIIVILTIVNLILSLIRVI